MITSLRFKRIIFITHYCNYCHVITATSDVDSWLEREALPISLPAVLSRTPLGALFSDKYHVSLLSILEHCFDAVFLGKALYPQMLHLTLVKMCSWQDRDDNVYDKLNAPKWLHDCMITVELK